MDQLTTLNPQALEQLKESSQLQQLESFFDNDASDSRSDRQLWITPPKNFYNDLRNKVILEAPMEKQGRTTHTWKMRYYILTEGFLAYKEV